MLCTNAIGYMLYTYRNKTKQNKEKTEIKTITDQCYL